MTRVGELLEAQRPHPLVREIPGQTRSARASFVPEGPRRSEPAGAVNSPKTAAYVRLHRGEPRQRGRVGALLARAPNPAPAAVTAGRVAIRALAPRRAEDRR